MKKLTVCAPSREYGITIGSGASRLLPDALRAHGGDDVRVAVVTDENVAQLHSEHVLRTLSDAGIAARLCVIGAGEAHKTVATVEKLYNQFTAAGLRRSDIIVALGGGIAGDVAGFAAATYMRATQFVQLPTTLVALVDSSVGGKTGVNLPSGKNLVGAFHQPSAVLADTDFLQTLPPREMLAGMAEVVKYYALGETQLDPLIPATPENLNEIAYLCCCAKARYVADDEADTGARRALNLGHTFAHAIEKYYDFDRYNHGEAVAIGLRLALEVGAALGITDAQTVTAVTNMLARAGLDTALDVPPALLVPLMLGDKKNTDSDITLVLLRTLGEPIIHKISPQALSAVLEKEPTQ